MTRNQKIHTAIAILISFFIPTSFTACSGEFRANSGYDELSSGSLDLPSNEDDGGKTQDPEVPVIPPVVVEQPLPPPTTDSVPAFVAVGHYQSSMMSCDGGVTWKNYRSLDNNMRCWQPSHNNFDCDHSPSSALGVTYGPQGFMATFGWGYPGHVGLSTNGRDWTSVQAGNTWAGVAYGDGTYILNEREPRISSNGTTWTRGGDINFIPSNARRIAFVNQGPGIFISTASSGNIHDLMISKDKGRTFYRSRTLPAGCGDGKVAFSTQRIVLLSNQLCVSNDQGETWQISSARPAGNNIIFDGSEFKVYSFSVVSRSTDGLNWTSTSLSYSSRTGPENFAEVAYHPTSRKYVAIAQDWGQYYEATQFYHSDNGLNWTRLAKNASVAPLAPHPVRQIAVGSVPNCN